MKKRYLLFLLLFISIFVSPVYASEGEDLTGTEEKSPLSSEVEDKVKLSTKEPEIGEKQAESKDGVLLEKDANPSMEQVIDEENSIIEADKKSKSAENSLKSESQEEFIENVNPGMVKKDENNKEFIKSEDNNEEDPENNKLLEGEVLHLTAYKNRSDENQDSKKVIEVYNFEDLKTAIKNASEGATIKIMKSFDIEGSIEIGKDKVITLTANNSKEADKTWESIKQPSDYKDQGEKKQREIIEEARKRGDAALELADLDKNPLPSYEKDIVIRRALGFTNGSLFNVLGKLTLGNSDSAVYIDGNGVRGDSVINVNEGGSLVLKNGTIYNSENSKAAINVEKSGSFTIDGGRISSNKSSEAILVSPGAELTMNNGLIDNNTGGMTGGIYSGNVSGSKDGFAIVKIKGGIIANNKSGGDVRTQWGGGIFISPKSKFEMTDGIIAGNKSTTAGGIAITDQFITNSSNVPHNSWSETGADYEEHLKTHEVKADINGGLIYKNKSDKDGGGVFVDTSQVNFGKTMILDNYSSKYGGGIYISWPPVTQKLENLLITENTASASYGEGFEGSNGGGLWNCPSGYVHINDGHSVYIYNNKAKNHGQDIVLLRKYGRNEFKINGDGEITKSFDSRLSPITKDGNIIRYVEDSGKDTDIPRNLSYTRSEIKVKTIYNDNLIKEAWKNSDTFVLGNRAANGGGIGSNANLDTPSQNKLKFHKKWDSSFDVIPEKSIEVDIYLVPKDKDEVYLRKYFGKDPSLFKYGEAVLSEENNWQFEFDSNELSNKKLDAKGYKYLVIEKGDKYFTEVTEIIPGKVENQRAGTIEIERIQSSLGSEWDNLESKKTMNIYLYKYDAKTKKLVLLEKQIMKNSDKEEDKWKVRFTSPYFYKNIPNSNIVYYGEKRRFSDRIKNWYDLNLNGYDTNDYGYALVIDEDENGEVRLNIPYLWIQDYEEEENVYKVGFVAKQLEEKTYKETIPEDHTFIITNYKPADLELKKEWKTKVKEKDLPDSVKFYLLLDGKRVIESYDDNLNPIYKTLELKKSEDWKGKIEKLNPRYLAAGRYTLEEEVIDIFAPKYKFQESDKQIKFRLAYQEQNYDTGEIGEDGKEIEGNTNDHFKSFAGDVKFNLYLDGKIIETQYFKLIDREISRQAIFGQDNKILLKLKDGQNLRISTYDKDPSEPGLNVPRLTEYNLYIQKDEDGLYTLYLPRLIIHGKQYELFQVTDLEEHQLLREIKPIEESNFALDVTNYDGPTHEIEFLKEWIGKLDKAPDSITLVITDKDNKESQIVLTKDQNWEKVLDNLSGTFRFNKYKIKEIKIDGYTSTIEKSLRGLKVEYEDKNIDENILYLESEEILKALKSGNYRYEIFELEDKDKILSKDNLNDFVKVVQNEDGSYTISYAEGLKLTEILKVTATNTYNPPENPPEEPKTPPEEPKTPPEEPKTPPKEVEVTEEKQEPKEELEIPKKTHTPDNVAPKTYDQGVGIYLALFSISLLGLYEIKRKKNNFSKF